MLDLRRLSVAVSTVAPSASMPGAARLLLSDCLGAANWNSGVLLVDAGALVADENAEGTAPIVDAGAAEEVFAGDRILDLGSDLLMIGVGWVGFSPAPVKIFSSSSK